MIDDTFLTLQNQSEGIYKEKGSRFLAFASPVKDEEEIKSKLTHLKKQYFTARHYCYAYILGKDKEIYRSNDDGEPGHSAGDPILGQIRSNNLTNVLIVVVRYFGGTKLGVGGLTTAYKTAAAEAIASNQIIIQTVTRAIKFNFDYADMNEVMRLVKENELQILQTDYENNCIMSISAREALADQLRFQLSQLPTLTILDQ